MKVLALMWASLMLQHCVPLWSQAPASPPSSQSSCAWPPASVSSPGCSDHASSPPRASTRARAQGKVSQHCEAQVTKPAVLYLLLLSWPFPWWTSQEERPPLKISAWLFSLARLLLRRLICDNNDSINSPKVFKSTCQKLSQPGQMLFRTFCRAFPPEFNA